MDIETGQATLPEPTLRDTIADNLATITAPETATTGSGQEQETAEQKAGRLANRLRDENGKLLPGTKPQEQQPTEALTNGAQPITPAPAEPKIQRPSSWKKDYWADFDKIATENPKLAAYLNQREGEFASGVSTYKHEWEQAKPLIDALAPFQPILQQHGINPATWISNLGNAHHRLAMGSPQDKVAMFQKLAADYQIPVQLAVQDQQGQWQLLGQQQMQPQQPQFDPSVIPRLVQQELQAASTKQALETFLQEAPEKHPHFEAVKATMAGLLQAGLAKDLPSAYEAALRHPMHADLFEAIQQQQREQQEAAAREAARQKVGRARSNAVSTPSSTPGGQMKTTGDKGLRDSIAENLRAAVGGRV